MFRNFGKSASGTLVKLRSKFHGKSSTTKGPNYRAPIHGAQRPAPSARRKWALGRWAHEIIGRLTSAHFLYFVAMGAPADIRGYQFFAFCAQRPIVLTGLVGGQSRVDEAAWCGAGRSLARPPRVQRRRSSARPPLSPFAARGIRQGIPIPPPPIKIPQQQNGKGNAEADLSNKN